MSGFMNMGLQGVKALFFTATAGAIVVAAGNLFVGPETTIVGTAPSSQIVMVNGVIPDATTDGLVFLGAKDASADTKATLSIYAERAVGTEAIAAADKYLEIWVNGEVYKLMLKAY